ncbi:MAG: endonuclease/exonuclease/phosphatase family protein [Epsilonproteobacteria bacterium]|nr:MAG: endonuclease/exonuclease/phosphatase family protein [Campylobacterota bacterium]
MFKPSILQHRSCRGIACSTFVPQTFSLLCWNVYKNNIKHPDFRSFLSAYENELDFMLFQEANFMNDRAFDLSSFTFDAAANLEVRGAFYGVLTASKVESNYAQAYLSKVKESFLASHKSLLVSVYPFEEGTNLLILNIHAINFRENQSYDKELERFLLLIQEHKGAMIVAGDFNTWNKKRMQKLHEIREKLELKIVSFSQTSALKVFMGKQLDFIFYKGLELVDSKVVTNHSLSDHNPLFVTFKKL